MEVQRLLDADPNNMSLKEKAVIIEKEYYDAADDELKLLHQKARVHWLKEEFLGKSQPVQTLSTMEDYVQAKLTEEEDLDMIKMVTDDDTNRKNEAKRCAMKIDIQKAYDTVNWDFLKNTLQLVGFHEGMIKWIMTCVTTASFSICINGEICRFFKGGKGLRQGDHISYYLFTLMMEVFNMIMIKNIDETHSFKYHYGCKELKLIRMCFADDLMVLCNGDKESLKIVKKSLDDFSNVSGLFPNLNKSIIFFGSLSEERKSELLEYWAYVYMLPMSVIHDLEKMFKRFLWNSGRSTQWKARVAWKLVCRPKEQGGLGIKPLRKWNEVLMITQL
ncbi:RNA-directed DNA polymerase, eukaryota, reverse transcriptase zinc-binding domain protein [Tanacetum coccineum]